MTGLARTATVAVVVLAAVVSVAAGCATASAGQTAVDRSANGTVWSQSYFTSARDEWDQRLLGVARTPDGLLLVGTGWSDLYGDEVVAYAAEATRDGDQTWGRPYMHAATHTRALHDGLKLDDGRYVFAGTTNAPSMTGVGEYLLFDNTGDIHTWRYARGSGAVYDVLPANETHVVAVGSGQVWSVATARGDGDRAWTYAPPPGVTLRAGTRTDDGTIVAGTRETSDGATAAFVAELGPAGDRRWSQTYGDGSVRVRSVATVGDDLAVGGTDGDTGWLARLDADGDVLWTGRPVATDGRVAAVAAGPKDTILAGGETGDGDGVVARFGSGGRQLWRARHGATIDGLLPARDGTTVAVGARENGDHLDAAATRIDFEEPTAAITVEAQRAEVGATTVTLQADGSTDNVGLARYHWDTDGDGTIDRTTDDPVLDYVPETVGSLHPRVTVEDIGGRTDTATATATVEVTDTTPPRAVIARPASGLVAPDHPTTLSAAGSRDNGAIRSYRWDFDGDGEIDATTSNATVVHTFDGRNGTFEVRLTVVDGAGYTDTTSRTVETRANDPPNLALSVDRVDAQRYGEGYEARVTAEVTNEVGNATVRWRLPDGRVLAGRTVEFDFAAVESVLEARVTDEYGASDYEAVELSLDSDGAVVDRNSPELPGTETADGDSADGDTADVETTARGAGFGPLVAVVALVFGAWLGRRD